MEIIKISLGYQVELLKYICPSRWLISVKNSGLGKLVVSFNK
jgi:hypothetical protein